MIFMSLLLLPVHLLAQSCRTDSIIGLMHGCDLLFQIADLPNAITDVTDGVGHLEIEHVGIYAEVDGRRSVIEALPSKGVCITPVDSFLSRNVSADGMPLVVVGRVVGDMDAEQSLKNALELVGCEYDSLYLSDNEAIYCSELVQKCFVDHEGKPVFGTIPMTFRDREGNIPAVWTELYARHGMAVPEGAPGTNPGELSRRENVAVVFRFFK